jgi:hypothetical protein
VVSTLYFRVPQKDDPAPPLGAAFRLDRAAFAVASLADPDDTAAFWRTKSPLERLTALDYLRRMAYGPAAAARLQRVFEIGQLGAD